MTKFTTASKKALSLLLAMLLTFSCMAVAASAEEPLHILTKENCVLDVDAKTINVTATTVKEDETDYVVKFEITNIKDVPSDVLANGNTKFYNLVNGKTYTVSGYIEIPGEDAESAPTKKAVTNAFDVSLKNSQNAPLAPIPEKIKATSIEIKAVTDTEYAILEKSSEDAPVYSESNIFKNLTAETEYKIFIRYKETDNAYASPATTITVTTKQASDQTVPAKPILEDKTNTTITVNKIDGQVYSIDEGKNWQSTPEFKNLKENTSYIIVTRKIYNPEIQEETPISEGLAIITNKRACFAASIDKCSMNLAKNEPIYVDTDFGFSFICDNPATADLVYGDTKFVATTYKTNQSTDTFSCDVAKTYKPTATGELSFTVSFDRMKYNGSDWVKIGTETKVFKFNVSPKYYKILDGLKKLASLLLNTVPAAINNFLKSGAISKVVDAIVNFGKKAA